MKRVILVVQEDPGLESFLRSQLDEERYVLKSASSILEARARLNEAPVDLVFSKMSFPDGDASALSDCLRGATLIPLEGSAHSQEIVTKAVAALRRFSDLSVGDIVVDLNRREVRNNDTPIRLRRREFDIFSILVRRREEIVTRREILKELQEPREFSVRNLDSHVSRIRNALRKAGADDLIITSVYGMGYKVELLRENERAG